MTSCFVVNKTLKHDVKLHVAVCCEALPELGVLSGVKQCCAALTGIIHFAAHIRRTRVFSFGPLFSSFQCLSKLERFCFVAGCVSVSRALNLNQTGGVFVLLLG